MKKRSKFSRVLAVFTLTAMVFTVGTGNYAMSATPNLSTVTAIPTYTNDQTPDYTFSSNEASVVRYINCFANVATVNAGQTVTTTYYLLAPGFYNNCQIEATSNADGLQSVHTLPAFTIDVVAPTIAISAGTKTSPGAITETITITDNEAILSTDINFTGSTSTVTPISCTQTAINQVDCSVSISTDGDLTVNATDRAGNVNSAIEAGYDVGAADVTAPSGVGSITASDTNLTDADGGSTFSLTVVYDETMDATVGFRPAFGLTPSVSGLIFLNGVWSTTSVANDTYTANYNFTDQNETVSGVDVDASGAQDVAGNPQNAFFSVDVFNVNTAPIPPGDTTAPILAEVTPVPDPSATLTPNYTFSTDEAGTISYGGACSSATTAATVGNNTISFNNLSNGVTYSNCTIIVTDVSLNASLSLAITPFTITLGGGGGGDVTAPILAEVTPVPDPSATLTPNYTFSTDEAGTITYGGACSGATTVATVGNNTISFNNLSNGVTYSDCTITVTDVSLNVSLPLSITPFTITLGGGGDVTAPILAEVTPVPDPSSIINPIYTFSTDEAGTIMIGGACTSVATNAVVGNNTIILDVVGDGLYNNCTVTVTDVALNASLPLAVTPFTVATGGSGDSTAPILSEVTPVSTPSSISTPSYTFFTDEAGIISYAGSCTSGTTVATLGNNTIIFSALPNGTYSNCLIMVTDVAGNPSAPLAVTPFTISVSSGGGGGGRSCSPLPGGTITINNNAVTTNITEVLINLEGTNATQVILSENSNFWDASYQDYDEELTFTLSNTTGVKTVHAIYKNSCGFSNSVSDTITYDPNAIIDDGNTEAGTQGGSVDDGEVLGEKIYDDGTLLRGPDGKIYIIIEGAKQHIISLDILGIHYQGAEIIDITQEELDRIPDYDGVIDEGEVLGVKNYPDGSLLRGPDNKIYIIERQTKRHIKTLQELVAFYAGREIINVSQDVLNQYPNYVDDEGGEVLGYREFAWKELLRGSDLKVYVINIDGSKTHIINLEELKSKYFGQTIWNVDDARLAEFPTV